MTEAVIKIQLDRGKPSIHRMGEENKLLELQLIGLRVSHDEGEGGTIIVETPGDLKEKPKKDVVASGRTRGFGYGLPGGNVFVQVEHT